MGSFNFHIYEYCKLSWIICRKLPLKGFSGMWVQIIYYDRFRETLFKDVGCDGTDNSEDIDKSLCRLYTWTRFFSPKILGAKRGVDNVQMQII